MKSLESESKPFQSPSIVEISSWARREYEEHLFLLIWLLLLSYFSSEKHAKRFEVNINKT